MSLLAPLFLLGTLAVGLPVVFHLIRRTTRQRTPFSSLMFLFPTPPRLTRRNRLEHLLLLLLRCAVICLLALGFSRPFIRKPMAASPKAPAKRILVLVDTSASMRRAGLWSDARDRIQSILRRVSPTDQVALFAFDREMKPLLRFEEWNAAAPDARSALATRALTELAPGWGSTRVDSALLSAAEILADTNTKQGPGPGEIILVTDLQEGSHLDLLQGAEWPRNVQVAVELVKPRRLSNASLQVVADSEDGDPNSPSQIRIRVENASGSTRDQFKVGWARSDGAGFVGNPTPIYVPAGQSRVVSLPVAGKAADFNRVLLQGDDNDFDNMVFVVPTEPVRLNVLYLGGESELDPKQPLYFLKRAFQQTRHKIVQVRAQKPDLPISDADLTAVQLVAIHHSLPPNLSTALRSFAATGKTVLFLLSDISQGPSLAALLGLGDLSITEVRPANYAMLSEIDFRAPVFAPFADPRFSDFTTIHFWKYRRLDLSAVPQAHALARFDSKDPALVEVPVDSGRILVLTSGWDPADSQLALSTKFVPLLYSMLETTGAPDAAPAYYKVGDEIPLASSSTGDSLKIVTPDNNQVSLPAGKTNFSGTLVPGIYTLVSSPSPRRFAVNTDPAESRTSPMSVDELARLGVPLQRAEPRTWAVAQKQVQLANADLENRQKLWRWLLVSALVILLMETWLAGLTFRRAAARSATEQVEPDREPAMSVIS